MVRIIIWDCIVIHSRANAINIFLCDLFFIFKGTHIASYADDTAPHSSNLTHLLIRNLKEWSDESLSIFWKHAHIKKLGFYEMN